MIMVAPFGQRVDICASNTNAAVPKGTPDNPPALEPQHPLPGAVFDAPQR